MKQNRLFILAALACIALLPLVPGSATAQIDGGYIGTSVCAGCHPDQNADFQASGHPFKFRETSGADCGAGACDALSNVLPTPDSASISTATNDAIVVDDGSGNLDWSVIQYVIGGWGWKSRYGMLDATDADGDGIDDTGYVWSGGIVQYNVLTDTWSSYSSGQDKEYNCGICHNTNGTRDMLASRTEPWATIPGAGVGFTSQWTFDGVQCEACHGPGQAHQAATTDPYPVDLTKTLCGQCHNRSGADDHGADTSGGFIRHHEQYNEQVGNTLEPGVHASLDCITCHDPHKRSHTLADFVATALGVTDNDQTAEERGAVVSCESCHTKSVRFHSDIQCIDCHMAAASKSATAEVGAYGKAGDVKTHIVKINPDPLAEDTNASPNSVTGTNVAHNYLTLNYACGKCHDSSMSTFSGVALSMTELGEYANTIHRSPVRQELGFEDTVFNNLSEADCRVCHSSGVPDRHHLLYGDAITAGACSDANGTCSVAGTPCVVDTDCPVGETCTPGTPGACLKDADCGQPLNSCFITGDACPVGLCDDGATSCTVDADCAAGESCNAAACPSSWTGQYCGQPICYGESAVVDSDADSDGNPDTNYGCLNCHVEDSSGGVITFVVERDCTVCHQQGLNQPTVHHQEGGIAQSGNCTACHGDLVDDPLGCKELCCAASFGPSAGQCTGPCTTDADCGGGELCVALGDEALCGDGHAIPTYAPSLVTPAPHTDNQAGGCTFCHDEGTDAETGVEVVNNHDTHHGAGVYKTSLGGSQRDKCAWCHKAGSPHNAGGEDADAIRFCENCHGYEALHNIQADSPNPANPGTIVVGGENPGYGHIGYDAGSTDGDCWGCHGFSTAGALASGPVIPTLTDSSAVTISSGEETTLTLIGSGFTNTMGAMSWTSDVAIDGQLLTPTSIDQGSLTVTIPALTAGIYDLKVVKGDVESNPIIINCIPQVLVSGYTCEDGVMTITGSGFGEAPAGTEEFINVTVGSASVEIVSWTDSQIVVNTAACGEPIVNALFGASSEGQDCCEGDLNGDGDVDGSDASDFKADFGRSTFRAPCTDGTCAGDFDCDGDQDGTDASLFKSDFGRSGLNNPCPGCTAAVCSY